MPPPAQRSPTTKMLRLSVLQLMGLLFLSLLCPIAAVITDENKSNEEEEEEGPDCGLYLAPSSIPGAGLGMYAGRSAISKNHPVVPRGGGDVIIPLIEMEWHTSYGTTEERHFLWDEYTWSWSNFGGVQDEITDPTTVSVASGGFGAAINCDMPLVNVHEMEAKDFEGGEGHPWFTYRMDASGVSSTSPGAGASSIFHGRSFYAKKDIEPYSELYASYGDNYFATRDQYWFVPMKSDYKKADHFMRRYLRMLYALVQKQMKHTTTSKDAPRSVVTDHKGFQSDLWNLVLSVRDVFRERMMYALPGSNTTVAEMQMILERGGTAQKGYNATIKDAKWMEENGQCMDNIMDHVSDIPHAGRGAFAKRFIPKGGLVAPAPLIHVPHRSVLNMYSAVYDEKGEHMVRDVETGVVHRQLILNYCFGRSETELLLCPYGLLTGLINHSTNPNTKVQWTNTSRMRHPDWLTKPVSEWGYEWHSGLSFDYVAIRDIEEGEEVTIDYGPEWELAWQIHVQQFEGNPPRRDYRPAHELNQILDLNIPLWPSQFQGVLMACRDDYFKMRGIHNGKNRWARPYRRGIEHEDIFGDYYLCRAIQKDEKSNTYTVEVYESGKHDTSSPWFETYEERVRLILFHMPADAFYFKDIAYERDSHQEWSFRHPMGLPDEVFPDIWKTQKAT